MMIPIKINNNNSKAPRHWEYPKIWIFLVGYKNRVPFNLMIIMGFQLKIMITNLQIQRFFLMMNNLSEMPIIASASSITIITTKTKTQV